MKRMRTLSVSKLDGEDVLAGLGFLVWFVFGIITGTLITFGALS